MSYRYHGHARVDRTSPRAFAVCDRCYRLFNKEELTWQFDWRGPRLMNLRILVCRYCLDKPQEQYRPIKLPPDPEPILNPRPEFYSTDDGTQGFSVYAIWPGAAPRNYAVYLTDGSGQNVVDANGNPVIIGMAPGKVSVLAQIVRLAGVVAGATLVDRSTTIAAANTAQTLMASNPARQWLAVFNPANVPFGFSTGTAQLNEPPGSYGERDSAINSTIMDGPGAAWAISGGAYQGAISVIGSYAGLPIWAWEG